MDADLDSYFTKTNSNAPAQNGKKKKNKADNSATGAAAPAKKRKISAPLGFVNLGYGVVADDDLPIGTERIVGTSTALEKDYYRLTSAPDPAKIRPQHVLQQSLQHIKAKWRTQQDYEWCCKQLKSVRQDATIQHLRNEFVVDVYETHARIAIETGKNIKNVLLPTACTAR